MQTYVSILTSTWETDSKKKTSKQIVKQNLNINAKTLLIKTAWNSSFQNSFLNAYK